MRPPDRHRSLVWRRPERWLYVTASLLWISGIGWLLSHYLFPGHGEFGVIPSPWEPWWMRLHGAAVMLFLVAFGALLPGHVMHGLRRAINSATGIAMLSIVAALALTGYGLYYAGDGPARSWIAAVHWVVGLAAAAGLSGHVILGRRRRAEARGRRPAVTTAFGARLPALSARRSARSDRRHRHAS